MHDTQNNGIKVKVAYALLYELETLGDKMKY
jgi:hypothetical protein